MRSDTSIKVFGGDVVVCLDAEVIHQRNSGHKKVWYKVLPKACVLFFSGIF